MQTSPVPQEVQEAVSDLSSRGTHSAKALRQLLLGMFQTQQGGQESERGRGREGVEEVGVAVRVHAGEPLRRRKKASSLGERGTIAGFGTEDRYDSCVKNKHSSRGKAL